MLHPGITLLGKDSWFKIARFFFIRKFVPWGQYQKPSESGSGGRGSGNPFSPFQSSPSDRCPSSHQLVWFGRVPRTCWVGRVFPTKIGDRKIAGKKGTLCWKGSPTKSDYEQKLVAVF